MKAAAVPALILLASCVSSEDPSGRVSTGGCLFWSTDCTRLEDPPPVEPLQLETEAPAPVSPVIAAGLPASETLPADDLGRVRAAHSARVRDTEGEAAFEARFAGENRAPTADTVYPLPSNCTSPPSSLLRNSPAGRFAPGRNSAAAGAYASAYARCGRPGTWPRPD